MLRVSVTDTVGVGREVVVRLPVAETQAETLPEEDALPVGSLERETLGLPLPLPLALGLGELLRVALAQ